MILEMGGTRTTSADTYNGNRTDKYVWSQSMNDLDVRVNVPEGVKKGKDVKVEIKADSLEIRLTGAEEPLIASKFSHPINKEDSYWNLTPGETINIWIQKRTGRY
jgi:hypothetical protein